MAKYYVPSIEEFHIGFEYELVPVIGFAINNFGKHDSETKTIWTTEYEKGIYGISDVNSYGNPLNSIKLGIKEHKCRVKHLDKEDIESLGLIYIENESDKESDQKYIGNFGDGFYFYLTVTNLSFTSIINLHTSVYKNSVKTKIVDSIRIKNKSELKRLLKQLNIKQ